MKANKALKRLAKIEAWMSDVTDRYLARSPGIRKVLQEAKAAVARAKEAVRLQTSSKTAKKAPLPPSKAEASRRRRAKTKAAAAKAHRAAKQPTPPRKKAAVKKAAVNAQIAKKSAPLRKVAKKTAAKKTVQVPVPTAEAVAHEPMQTELTPSAPGSSLMGNIENMDE